MADWKERYLQLWQNATKQQRYIAMGAVALLLALVIGAGYFYGSKPDMVPLFANMETKDAGEVAAKLKEAKINYDIQETKQGVTVLVQSKDVHSARLDLAAQGLPRGNKGFEIFDDSKLGVTEFQNRVNYLQALQGELTRTIEQIAAIDKVRVHIVLPEDSLYKKNEKPASASIMLSLLPDKKLSKKEIKGIVNLTAHSVQGLSAENITIIDSTGRILNDPEDDEDESHKQGNVSQQTLTQLDMTRKVQDRMQKDLQTLLDQALGQGRAFVRVNVELDFDQRSTDKQVFTPVVDDSGIIRSQQEVKESYSGTSNNPGGAAGIQSNVPGYVANVDNANAQYDKKETTKNFEINEERHKIVASPGAIKRVNVAVLVNDDVTRAQQDSIMRAVSSAVGANPERGDTVSVEPLPFSTSLEDWRIAAEANEKAKQDRIFFLQCFGIGLLLLLIIGRYAMKKREEYLERKAEEERQRLMELAELEREEAERQEAERLAAEQRELERQEAERLAAEEEERRQREEAEAEERRRQEEAEEDALMAEQRRKEELLAKANEEAPVGMTAVMQDDGSIVTVPTVKVASLLEPDERQMTEEELRTKGQREAIQGLIDKKPADVAMLLKAWLSDD